MAEIRIMRTHALGIAQARQLARRWAEVAEQKLEMDCRLEQGPEGDVLHFARPGASGELRIGADHLQLQARLGLLLGVFRGRIEKEIVSNLDSLLAEAEPLKAFEAGLADHEARRAARHAARKAAARPAAARKAR